MVDLITAACGGFLAGWIFRARLERRLSRWQRHVPYSSAAIAWRAIHEDPAEVRSKIVNPLAWDEGSVQRGNGSGGPLPRGSNPPPPGRKPEPPCNPPPHNP